MQTRTSGLDSLIGLAKTVAVALAIAFVPRVVFCQPYTIPSGSMEPTLLVGDYILVAKYPYGWSRHSIPFNPPLGQGRLMGRAPKRGDIVVFKEPRDGKTDIIKRLVGLPGDRLQVVRGVLQLNGQPVPRQFVANTTEATAFGGGFPVQRFKESLPNGRAYLVNSYGSDTAAGNTGLYVVPAGCYFMMGDNRDNSADSRFKPGEIGAGQSRCAWNTALDKYLPPEEGAGYVPFDDLVGRADMILFSWKHDAPIWNALRWDRMFHRLGANAA
ncbi:signal peptidase I [Caulobacter sp. S45]|uniref:signal peptidase I n=1 Tax=Caulobacter sp. S45 TaxID=1641861 RepID=UPI00131BB2D0|nr:signal peptidase I [Caulobacter sp. S45]